MFVDEGVRVVIGDLDGAAAAERAETLGDRKVAVGVRYGVTDASEVDHLHRAATDSFSAVDVMVKNAGSLRDATMRTMTEEQFDAVIGVHLKGTWNGTRKAAAVMRDRKRGAIVNVSLTVGKIGSPGQTNYAAAKAGIVGLAKAAAKEMAHHGFRVNTIQPGLVLTAMTEVLPQHIWDQKVADIPLGRVGKAPEIVSVGLFLASRLSSFMTGTVLEVTGGRYM
jgi:3-oxoacyl-[acyl-carrier protein] reductase